MISCPPLFHQKLRELFSIIFPWLKSYCWSISPHSPLLLFSFRLYVLKCYSLTHRVKKILQSNSSPPHPICLPIIYPFFAISVKISSLLLENSFWYALTARKLLVSPISDPARDDIAALGRKFGRVRISAWYALAGLKGPWRSSDNFCALIEFLSNFVAKKKNNLGWCEWVDVKRQGISPHNKVTLSKYNN